MRINKENKSNLISQSIREIYNFPLEGIIYKDITTLLNNSEAFEALMQSLEDRYVLMDIDYVAGIDSRGFIFGAALATRIKCGFVPIRKKGKLPHTTHSESYDLEYGADTLEIHTDAFNDNINARVLMIDDLIATGGTAVAAHKLIKKTGANCIESCFILKVDGLPGLKLLSDICPNVHIEVED
jgi:adenine phosphoribosyltransferase